MIDDICRGMPTELVKNSTWKKIKLYVSIKSKLPVDIVCLSGKPADFIVWN